MAFLNLMNFIHMLKKVTMPICQFVRLKFIGHSETSLDKMEGKNPALIFGDSVYLHSSEKMMKGYRTRLFDYCNKRGFQVLVLLEVNNSNKSCENLAIISVLQLVEKHYIDTILILGEISQKRWTETFKNMLKREIKIEVLPSIGDLNTDSRGMVDGEAI